MSAVLAYQMEDDFQLRAANDNAPCRLVTIFRFRCATDKSADPLCQQKAARQRFIHAEQISHHVYDGNLKRVRSIVNGKTIYNVYDASGKLAHVHKVAGAGQSFERSDYVSAGGKAIARVVEGGVAHYTFSDHLGSPVATMSGASNTVQRERYTPFGIALNDPNVLKDQAGFTGHIKDSATGLNLCIFCSKNCTVQARYYDPVIGRFLSVDPVTMSDMDMDPNYFNRYSYTANDPINYSDPSGKYRCKKSACPTVDKYVSKLKESRNSKSINSRQRALIDRAISAIGEKGEKGSVKIKLKKKYGGLAKFTGKSIVINPDLVDSIDHGATVLGHEASHLATQNETGVKARNENTEQRYDNEVKAYETGGTVTSAVDQALGVAGGFENPQSGAKASMKDFCGKSTEGKCGE